MRIIEDRTPIDELLEEQQRLHTPVAGFSDYHDRVVTPDLEPIYRDLIPLSRPEVGEQYAFEVNMDACTGCKACVTACHSMNGLEEHETWRDVGLIHSRSGQPYQQTVTSACHHCVEPACMHGCPVLAYEKDAETGIVTHLDDQCIGCQYCVLKCPYDVPKYSEFLGIVRKCDMCHGRLAESEAPACVQACPTSAISITIVETEVAHADALAGEFLNGAPDPSYTVPTTRYVGAKGVPSDVIASDSADLKPEPTHLPLVFMLVSTQWAMGCFFISLFVGETVLPLVGVFALGLGIGTSVLHLGKPLGAWRSFLGLKRSWLSREIVAFGVLLPVATAYAFFPHYVSLSLATTVLCGMGVFSSVMLYADTRRLFWSEFWSGTRFLGTAVLLGVATWAMIEPTSSLLVWAILAASILKLSLETYQLKKSIFSKSSRLMRGPLVGTFRSRFIFGVSGGIVLPMLILAAGVTDPGFIFLSWFMLVVGELFERTLFFQAVEAPRMPGGLMR